MLRLRMKRTNPLSQANYLVYKRVSMLALIEVETITKPKSKQTSFKKTAPNLCVHIPEKGR